ncbi:MAG: DNA-directed polymerase, partial [Candidatus Saccharibacteria bacterium]|nr:DNA-directed polymerase [Candidatus Saccharibacteria bacterium]
VLVDDAREVTQDQAAAYQPTGKKRNAPKPGKKVSASKVGYKSSAESTDLERRVYVRIERSDDHDTLLSLKETITLHHGDTEVVLVLGPTDQKQIIRLPMRMTASEDSLLVLSNLVGAENVRLR